jgi:hypothetical protein
MPGCGFVAFRSLATAAGVARSVAVSTGGAGSEDAAVVVVSISAFKLSCHAARSGRRLASLIFAKASRAASPMVV